MIKLPVNLLRRVLYALLLASGPIVLAAPATTAPADPASDRLTFLMLQLSSAEESIKALNAGMRAAGYKALLAADKAESYKKGNEIMDRKGGAPVPWESFYGKTADSFHTFWNDPIRRPKQFDYIYKANNAQAAKAKEETAAMGKKIDVMLARRRKIEAEQSMLWATISLESIQNLEIPFKPLYHWQLKPPTTQPGTPVAVNEARVGTLRALALFLRTADHAAKVAAEAVANNQEKTFTSLKETIGTAQGVAQENAFRASQTTDLNAADLQQIKDALAITKRMAAIGKNITEAYRLAMEGDIAEDEQRKLTFRGQLQDSLLSFADATVELDAAITKMAAGWGIRGEAGVDSPDKIGEVASAVTVTAPSLPLPTPSAPAGPSAPSTPGGPTVSIFTPPVDTAGAGAFRFATVPPAPTGVPKRVITNDDRLMADMTLSAANSPYEIQDKASLTNGKVSKRVHLFVSAGVEIHGGEIHASSDCHLEFEGAASSPVIIRNVKFVQFLDGYARFRDVIFDHCSFRKGGPYYSRDGLTTKWVFENCLLNECEWPAGISWVDCGVKFTNTTFVGMQLPNLEIRTSKDKPVDFMASLRTPWRIVDKCSFENCAVPQSFFWCSESSNFVHCKFSSRGPFESDKATEVIAYVADSQSDRPDQLIAENPPKRAPITIK